MSLLIHFSVEQVNSEIELNAGSEASSSSDRLNVPSPLPSPQVALITPPRKIQSSLKSLFPVTFKAYTEAPVSWKTKDELDRKLIVRAFINYGISYAQKTTRVPGNILCGIRWWEQWARTSDVLYGYLPVMCNRALIIIKKESSNRRERGKENQKLLYTAF